MYLFSYTITALNFHWHRIHTPSLVCWCIFARITLIRTQKLLISYPQQDFHRRVVPKAGLDKVIVSDELARSLKEIVQFEKARYMYCTCTCTLYMCTYSSLDLLRSISRH